jgi:hypothetical protein
MLTQKYRVNGEDITFQVYMKVAEIMDGIDQELQLGCETVSMTFLHSQTYQKINDISSGYWKLDSKDIVSDYLVELKNGNRN